MTLEAPKYFSESQRRSFDRGAAHGKAEGKAEGKADTLLTILVKRGLAVNAEQEQQIRSCTDLATLDRWVDRVLSAASVDELLR